MRFLFLIPDLGRGKFWRSFQKLIDISRLRPLQDFERLRIMRADQVYGGTLNMMRHCQVARNCGADAYLATISGRDTYGELGIYDLPFTKWADREENDVCIVPDLVTELIDEVRGPVVAYLQVPIFTHANFDYKDQRVALWTDSPFMLEICRKTYPGKDAEIVPNVVDDRMFPFIPQSEREPGLIFAFPRKGPDYINKTKEYYRKKGGTYWHFELIDGLSIHELSKQFRRPQAFLASAEVEGCALPPQESMAAGIVVVGKTARGANFSMQHRETAMIAETPEEAAECLRELEDPDLRDRISRNGHEFISRYFPSGEPAQFWKEKIKHYKELLNQLP